MNSMRLPCVHFSKRKYKESGIQLLGESPSRNTDTFTAKQFESATRLTLRMEQVRQLSHIQCWKWHIFCCGSLLWISHLNIICLHIVCVKMNSAWRDALDELATGKKPNAVRTSNGPSCVKYTRIFKCHYQIRFTWISCCYCNIDVSNWEISYACEISIHILMRRDKQWLTQPYSKRKCLQSVYFGHFVAVGCAPNRSCSTLFRFAMTWRLPSSESVLYMKKYTVFLCIKIAFPLQNQYLLCLSTKIPYLPQ